MNIACTPIDQTYGLQEFSWKQVEEWVQHKIHFAKRILDKHTDVVSNLGILAITTCLLASKIFEQTPKILPRLAMIVYNYAGIIWLNVQARDLIKSIKDLSRSIQQFEKLSMLETAAKVFVKVSNIMLTCVIFTGSVLSAFVFPEASLTIALSIRSFSLSCLCINVFSDIRDYFANQGLLRQLHKIEAAPNSSILIGKIMVCFLEIIKNMETPSKISLEWTEEWKLTDRLVRQLDHYTIETFQESLQTDRKEKVPLVDAIKLFYGIKDGMQRSQAFTEANICLTYLGYASMGICRAFPDTLIEMLARWSMSVLYTDEFIQRKFFQADLAERIN
jgi:hypothetical protein